MEPDKHAKAISAPARRIKEALQAMDMTPNEAEHTYRKLSEPDRPERTGADWRHIVAATLDGLATAIGAVSDALVRVSHGLERSHRW